MGKHSVRSAILLLAVIFLCLTCPKARSEQYDYFPGAPGLGEGFDRTNPVRPLRHCLDISKITPRALQAVGPYQANSKLIVDRSELYSALHIDVNVSAHSLAASGSANTDLETSTQTKSNITTWMLRVYQDFGSQSLSEENFVEGAKGLRNTLPTLLLVCGKEYVSKVQLASQLTVLFTSTDLSATESSNLGTSISGGFSAGAGGVSVSASLRSTMTQIATHHGVEIRMFGFGAGGVQKLGDAITNNGDIDQLLKDVNTYLTSEFTTDKAFPIQFFTSDTGLLAANPRASQFVVDKPELPQIYLDYMDATARYTALQRIVRERDTTYGYLKDDQISNYKSERDVASAEKSAAYKILQDCANNTTCKTVADSQLHVRWPTSPEPSCQTWEHYQCVECRQEITFTGEPTGLTLPYSCRQMPANALVHVDFNGFIVISSNVPDSKVWNAWIDAYLNGITEPCSGNLDGRPLQCKDSRVSTNQVKVYQWKLLKMHAATRVGPDNSASASLFIGQCQTGPTHVTCDTVPPGLGAVIEKVGNNGFPPDVPNSVQPPNFVPAPAGAFIRFSVAKSASIEH